MYDYTNLKQSPSRAKTVSYDAGLRAHMLRVYNYMMVALAITGVVSLLTASMPALLNAIFGTPLIWVVMLAPIVMVLFLSVRLTHLSLSAAKTSLWVFSGLMGLSMASIFMTYTSASIAKVFFISASMFGGMSLYGYTTKRDLTSFGSFLFMGLIGLIMASVVNLLLRSPAMEFVISLVGVLVFLGLTAYDTHKIKEVYYMLNHNKEGLAKASVMAALTLYLDFINIFMYLLRLFGDRKS